ncbi:MAG: hypothetical protein K0R39_1461 [Symbiobacteriaceae bacterium]|jgi:hypothetical protein|nr:hypothetical protein [Symbiobacteriaceae bacterium]
MFTIYLAAGLAAIGLLCWLLYQASLRHRRLQAELVRLERLAAEVTLHAEQVLDQVDERTHELQELVRSASVQVTAAAQAAAMAQADPAATARVPAPVALSAPVAPVAPGAPGAPPAPAEPDRYNDLRTQVISLAGRGVAASQIAQMLGLPRGEVSLILNLSKKKATA